MTNSDQPENFDATNSFADQSTGTYLLTIRRTQFDPLEAADFLQYFELLGGAGLEILVVDGSPNEVFVRNKAAWANCCRHEPVDPQYEFLNGKVNGIHTGVELARHDRIVLADDDIRYTAADAKRMIGLLETCDLVRPQNYFAPLPVWARTEAARMLINRAVIREGDYSGTLGIRRDAMRAVGHYDGDVLFDNEEIVRHFRACNRNICYARDFFVLKLPATFQKWLEQRPRQAYEDFVMRLKTLFFAALPVDLIAAAAFGGAKYAVGFVLLVGLGSILLAALGLGDGATRFFPISSIFFAPLWIVERSVSTYLAFYWYFTRGGYPFGDKTIKKGTGRAWRAASAPNSATNDDLS